MRDSFIFHGNFLEGLPEKDMEMWCYYIVRYGLFDEEPNFDNPYMTTVWIKIKNFMDTNQNKWQKKKEANKLRYEENKEKLRKIQKIQQFSENSENLPDTHGVSVSEYDSESVSEYDSVSVSVKERGGQKSTVPQKKKFQKPTLEKIKAYVYEKSYTFDSEAFYNFYESNGWKVGKNPMKDWKAACKTWQQRETVSGKKGRIASDEEVNLEEYQWAYPMPTKPTSEETW